MCRILMLYFSLCLTFKKPLANHFIKVVVSFYILTSNVWDFQFLHILATLGNAYHFDLAMLVGMWWHLVWYLLTFSW